MAKKIKGPATGFGVIRHPNMTQAEEERYRKAVIAASEKGAAASHPRRATSAYYSSMHDRDAIAGKRAETSAKRSTSAHYSSVKDRTPSVKTVGRATKASNVKSIPKAKKVTKK